MRHRRVRVGQVGHSQCDHGASVQGDPRHVGCDPPGRDEHLRHVGREAARPARPGRVDDLPGPALGAQSADDGGRADHRGDGGSWRRHPGIASRPRHRALDRSGSARSAAHVSSVSVPAFRRAAAAGDDRHGPGARAHNPDRGRANDRTRRDHPGADPEADPRDPAPQGHERDVHHPRLRGGGRDRRQRRGDGEGPDRRAGQRRAGPEVAGPSLHPAPDRGRPASDRRGPHTSGCRQQGADPEGRWSGEDLSQRQLVVRQASESWLR